MNKIRAKATALSYTSLLFHCLSHFLVAPFGTEYYLIVHYFYSFNQFLTLPFFSHFVLQSFSIYGIKCFSNLNTPECASSFDS